MFTVLGCREQAAFLKMSMSHHHHAASEVKTKQSDIRSTAYSDYSRKALLLEGLVKPHAVCPHLQKVVGVTKC